MHYLRQLPVDLAFVTLQRLFDSHSLPDLVLIVVEQQLGEGGDVGQGEDGAEDLEAGLAGELLVVRRTHDGGLQRQNALTEKE